MTGLHTRTHTPSLSRHSTYINDYAHSNTHTHLRVAVRADKERVAGAFLGHCVVAHVHGFGSSSRLCMRVCVHICACCVCVYHMNVTPTRTHIHMHSLAFTLKLIHIYTLTSSRSEAQLTGSPVKSDVMV
jgi:hypothetical protein